MVARGTLQELLIMSVLSERAGLSQRLGKSFSDDRDIYTALGYTKTPIFDDYLQRYTRQDIARRIVQAPVKGTWRKKPVISESNEEVTNFEQAWNKIVSECSVYHYFVRAEIVARLGQYGVLLIGCDDNKEMSEPLDKASNLLYLQPYSEVSATIDSYEKDQQNERYGKPTQYTIKMSTADKSGLVSHNVHHSRILHIAEDLDEDSTFGTPALRSVLNRLQDLELVIGGCAEGSWRGGFPGYNFKLDAEADPTQSISDARDQIEDYMHGFKRYLRLQGIDVQALEVQVTDPKNIVAVLIDMISSATRIPKRILLGSERGELASSQDENNWLDYLDERRIEHCEPVVLRPFIDKMIAIGVLPEPKNEYTVEWPNLKTKSQKEEMEVAKLKTEALAKYVMSLGADQLIPPYVFLTEVLKFSRESVEEWEGIIK